jgi:hypothetical protein
MVHVTETGVTHQPKFISGVTDGSILTVDEYGNAFRDGKSIDLHRISSIIQIEDGYIVISIFGDYVTRRRFDGSVVWNKYQARTSAVKTVVISDIIFLLTYSSVLCLDLKTGNFLTGFGGGYINNGNGMAVAGKFIVVSNTSGTIYLFDSDKHELVGITHTGHRIRDICCDGSGYLYIYDAATKLLEVYLVVDDQLTEIIAVDLGGVSGSVRSLSTTYDGNIVIAGMGKLIFVDDIFDELKATVAVPIENI